MRPGSRLFGLSELSAQQQDRARAWLPRLGRLFALGGRRSGDARPVEELILGGSRRYTWTQLLDETGMSAELAVQLWRGMGFAEVEPEEVAFTDADLKALRRLDQARAQGLVPAEVQLAAVRPLGQAMAGLADWQIDTLYQIAPLHSAEIDEEHIHDTVEKLLALLHDMQDYVWRRHLAATAARLMAAPTDTSPDTSPDTAHTRTLVVGFADMVGFTYATRRLPPAQLLDLIDRFQTLAAELVTTHHGRVVKTIGDEVLFITDHPDEAAQIALDLIDHTIDAPGLPELRIGMATGPVMTRFGDVYGEVVNIAARLTTHAKPGRILIDSHLADALTNEPGYRVRLRRPLNVRGYNNLRSWGLTRAAENPSP
jgi:adenylate cyclase